MLRSVLSIRRTSSRLSPRATYRLEDGGCGGTREKNGFTCASQHASKSWAAIIISVGSFPSGERMATSLAMAAAVLRWSPVTMLRKGREGRRERKSEKKR